MRTGIVSQEHITLSSRPERRGVEGPCVFNVLRDFPRCFHMPLISLERRSGDNMPAAYETAAFRAAVNYLSSTMPTFAAVDIGANSVRLKIARLVGRRLREIHEDREVTRLGEGVFRSGLL